MEPSPQSTSESAIVSWILRIGVAGCFIGHGAFGIITKSAWVPYFAVAGIGEAFAWPLMPVIGAMDILIGILAALWPCRFVYGWAAIWAVWTALLRPLAGEPFWEFLERAGNYGVPIAALLLAGAGGSLFARLPNSFPVGEAARRLRLIGSLRLTTAILLAGHAGLGLFAHKAGLAHHYASIGLENAEELVPAIGAIEFGLAALALFAARPGVFVGICIWKLITESLFVTAGSPIWEVIERFGSYAAPLALAVLL